MLKCSNWMMVLVLCAVAAGASAEGYDFNGQTVDVEYWTGTGENEAMMIVDFAQSAVPGDSYAFGFRWDGEKTSEDMLLALDADGADGKLDVQYHNDPTFGFGVDGFSYAGSDIVSDGWDETFPGSWWDGYDAYTDFSGNTVSGENPDGTFEPSQLGASSRVLDDGYMDGWSQEYTDNGLDPIHTPTVPVVPEPATMTMFALGGVALIRRRKQRD